MSITRIGAVAGVLFVVIGAIELALTGGPAPDYAQALDNVEFFAETSEVGPLVGVLSGLAGASFLVFALVLRERCSSRVLGNLVGAAAITLLALAWAGQVMQQAAWRTTGEVEGSLIGMLGTLASLAFAFALVGGGVMAATVAVEAWRSTSLPTWLAPVGVVVALVVLLAVAVPAMASAAFPVFLVWLLGASAALARTTTREPLRA